MKTINKISLLCRYTVFEGETRAQKHDYFADNSILYWVFFFSLKIWKGLAGFSYHAYQMWESSHLGCTSSKRGDEIKSLLSGINWKKAKPITFGRHPLVTTLIFPKLWSPHGLWLPKESSMNTWGTRQLEGTKGTHTISLRNTHISAKLPPPIYIMILVSPQLQPKTKPQQIFLKNPK